ncbi:hypothetical protein EZ313_06775 [Ramlibacter henchirensis]|uniref:Uncharacterized protein n=1 Tax=Ramlibacter henchirensis TaxID=204072 RepID=A0A4Z0C5V1_9BURK|nr:hypothetical protein [Ramlibacter henchirensis]TFZ06344.1 hypothetical protein EZ313_06775 [Ramlibacter henchirensis]
MAKAREFWEWFQEHEPEIRHAYLQADTSHLDDLLSLRVANATSGAGWEIGPYALPSHAFVFSPGNADRISACRELVDAAPDIPTWRFFHAKPAKDLTSLRIEVGAHEICAERWYYRLTSYRAGEFVDVELLFEEADSPSPADAVLAGELLLEALLGELVFLQRVGRIEPNCVPSLAKLDRATPLRYLRRHLDSILKPLQ